jgi:peptidoglycan/xylan/chitin deacetylase (PgdA/CDA1 family)
MLTSTGEPAATSRLSPAERAKYAVKFALAHALYYLGLLHAWQSIVLRRKAVVLTYHRVLKPQERAWCASHPGIVVERQTFVRHIQLLKRRFRLLTIDEFARRMEQKIPFADSSCLITFDDGWRDNYSNAFPVLLEAGVPAVIFLPVSYIGERRLFWQEALTRLLTRAVVEARRDRARFARLDQILRPFDLHGLLRVESDPRPAIWKAVTARKVADGGIPESLLVGLGRELGPESDGWLHDGFINWDQVRRMAAGPIAFGGHGAEHRLLTEIPLEAAREDIRRAKDVLDAQLAGSVETFSYPNGSWNPNIAALLREAGYRLAFTTDSGPVTCEHDPMAVRRINIHEDMTRSTPMFMARLVGLL